MVDELKFLGNKDLLKTYKVGFLCSRKVPPNIILKTYDWAVEQRDKGVCVVSGFHSKIEKDVFEILIKGKQPIILVLARGIYKSTPKVLKKEIDKERLLIISPFKASLTQISTQSSFKRNCLIVEISDELFVPHVSSGGNISKALSSLNKNKKVTILSH